MLLRLVGGWASAASGAAQQRQQGHTIIFPRARRSYYMRTAQASSTEYSQIPGNATSGTAAHITMYVLGVVRISDKTKNMLIPLCTTHLNSRLRSPGRRSCLTRRLSRRPPYSSLISSSINNFAAMCACILLILVIVLVVVVVVVFY